MVGRLIHNKEIGIREKHRCNCNLLYLSAAKLAHLLIKIGKLKLCEHPLGALLKIPSIQPIHLCKSLFQPLGCACSTLSQCAVILLNCLIEPLLLPKELMIYGILRIKIIVLLEEGNGDILHKFYAASRVGTLLPCQYGEQRALASSVRRNKGNLIPLIYIKGDIPEEHLGAIRFANILYL